MNRQQQDIKDKWCRRLTGSGIREIDSWIYVGGETSIQSIALTYKEEMVSSTPDGSGTDVWADINPKESSIHLGQAFRRLKTMAQAYSAEICSETYGDVTMY